MYRDKKVIHIVCTSLDGGIGKDNKLLFNLPPDLKFFREQTMGHVLMMGRKTVDSLPKPLDRRAVLCVSNHYSDEYESYRLTESYLYANLMSNQLNTDKIFICGGSQLYSSTFDVTDELWVTQVASDIDADVFYNIPDDFCMFEEGNWLEHVNPVGEVLTYRFTKWKRKGE